MLGHWWASAESKYWCNYCYFQCWHTTNLQFILLFTTLFIQPVQIEPQPPSFTSFPPSFPLPPSQIFAFPLDLCVMSWLGSDRHYTQDCLQREKRRSKCHTDKNDQCDKHKWIDTCFLSHTHMHTFMHENMHTWAHTQSHKESIWINPNYTCFFLSLQITSVKQIVPQKMRARYTVSWAEPEGNLVVLYLERGVNDDDVDEKQVGISWKIKCERPCVLSYCCWKRNKDEETELEKS